MSFQFPQAFDVNSVAPATGGGNQLPVSDSKGHLVVITESEVVPVANKPNAAYIKFDVRIIEGEHAGAEGIYRVNYFSDSEQAANIAKGQLSALGHVCHVQQLANTAQLHNVPFRMVVKPQKGAEEAAKGYTDIAYVLNADGSKAGSAPGSAATAAPAAPPVAPPAPPAAAAPAAGQWGAPAAPVEAAPQPPAWGQPAAAAAPAASPPWATKPA
jgi:hypothetical protein